MAMYNVTPRYILSSDNVGYTSGIADTANFYLGDAYQTITKTSTSYIEFVFSGTQFKLYGQTYSRRNNNVKMYVDGVYSDTLNCTTTGSSGVVLMYTSPILTTGNKVIRLAIEEGMQNSNNGIYLDKFVSVDGELVTINSVVGDLLPNP